MDGADVRMIERGGGAGLLHEALAQRGPSIVGMPGELGWEKLEGDNPVEFAILRLVDHTHPATAQFRQDGVVGDRASGKRVGVIGQDWKGSPDYTLSNSAEPSQQSFFCGLCELRGPDAIRSRA